MAQAYGWDGILPKPRMPAVGETVNGEPFSVPRGSQAVTFHVPTLAGATTLKLQALDPQGHDSASPVWRDIYIFNIAAGGVQQLAAIPEDAATTLPTAAIGAGVLRLVASSDQSAAPVNISIVFSRL